MPLQEPLPPLSEAIIELYLNVKVRSNEEISNYDESVFEKEKDKLRELSPHTVLDYIKSSVEILMNIKSEERKGKKKKDKPLRFCDESDDILSATSQSLWSTLEQFKDGPPKEYEEAIQKLEGDVRMHIRVEQQMRLHIENLQQKIEDIEKANNSNISKIKKEIENLKVEK